MPLAFAMFIFLTTSGHAADAPLAASLTKNARADYDRGREAFKTGRFEAAEIAFRGAYQASSDARLLWNIAACESKRGRFSSMLTTLSAYETERGAKLSTEEQGELQNARAAARQRVARVTVKTTPDQVELVVNDAVIAITPREEPIHLDPGVYDVLFRKHGFRDVRSRESLTVGSAAWTVSLLPLPPAAGANPKTLSVKSIDHTRRNPLRATGVVTTAVGAALVVSGAIFLGLAHSKYASLKTTCNDHCDGSEIGSGRALETGAWIGLSVGSVATIGGALLYAIAPKKTSERAE